MNNTQEELALHQAALDGDLETVRQLIQTRPDHLDASFTEFRFQLLHDAAWKNHPDILEYLLDNTNLDVDCPNIEGTTPLNTACYFGSARAARTLLCRHANPDIKNEHGYSPFDSAINKSRFNVIAVSLNEGIKVEEITTMGADLITNPFLEYENGWTLLKALLVRDVAVKKIGRLHARKCYAKAAEYANLVFARLLYQKYHDSISDVLHKILEQKNRRDQAAFLITNKFGVNALDSKGRTPLYVAAHNGNLKMVKLLVKNGAINSIIEDSPRSIALKRGYNEIGAFLTALLPTKNEP